jgi:hypothetical protein
MYNKLAKTLNELGSNRNLSPSNSKGPYSSKASWIDEHPF